jgi:hypothetical protein
LKTFPGIVIALAVLLACSSCPSFGESSVAISSAPHGWRERSAGLFASRPPIRFTPDNVRFSGEADLAAGTGVFFERPLASAGTITGFDLSVQADGCNLKSNDYHEGDARFPISVTVVMGQDRPEYPFAKQVGRFFARLWNGFPSRGLRLTYVWGCGTPVGSMFRLSDEETVFVVAGQDEIGKRIEARRVIDADFKAAYGRASKGTATEIRVRFDRPSNEKGNLRVAFDLNTSP